MQVEAAEIPQLDPLELFPDALTRIQVWSIRQQTLQVEAWHRPVREEFLNGMAAVDRRSITDDHQTARDLTQQVLQKRDNAF